MRRAIEAFPVAWTRTMLRALLGTAPPELLPEVPTNAPLFRESAEPILETFVEVLHGHAEVELLLGFPAAPFIVPLATTDRAGFLRYARSQPSHPVRLRR